MTSNASTLAVIKNYITTQVVKSIDSGGICACCGSMEGTPVQLPKGLAYLLTKAPQFPEIKTEQVADYLVESVSIKVNEELYLNLQTCASVNSSAPYILPFQSGSPYIEFLRNYEWDGIDTKKEVLHGYMYGLALPILSEAGARINAPVYGEKKIYLGSDYTREEYIQEVKNYLKGKTVIWVFKNDIKSYRVAGEVIEEIFKSIPHDVLYSREFNNRNSYHMKNVLTVKVYKYHD